MCANKWRCSLLNNLSFLYESKKLILIWTLWTWVSPDVCILCLQTSKFRPNLDPKLSFVKERAIVLQGSWIAWIWNLTDSSWKPPVWIVLSRSECDRTNQHPFWGLRRYLHGVVLWWKRKAANRKRLCCYQLAQLVVMTSGLLVLHVKKQNALQLKGLLQFPDGHLENIQNWACQVTKIVCCLFGVFEKTLDFGQTSPQNHWHCGKSLSFVPCLCLLSCKTLQQFYTSLPNEVDLI